MFSFYRIFISIVSIVFPIVSVLMPVSSLHAAEIRAKSFEQPKNITALYSARHGNMTVEQFLIAYYEILAENINLPKSSEFINLKNNQAKPDTPLYRALQKGVMMGIAKNQDTQYNLKSRMKQDLFARMVERDLNSKLNITKWAPLTYGMLTDTLIDIIVPSDNAINSPTTEIQKDETPTLTQVRSILKANYYHAQDVSDDKKIERDAIRGVVDGLGDPYSDFYDGTQSTSLKTLLEGTLVWVGMIMEKWDKYYRVNQVIAWSPAERAWVLAGDLVKKVDGVDVDIKTFTIEEVVTKIRWEENTQVIIDFDRGGVTIARTLIRAKIQVPNISSKVLNESVGYVDIRMFPTDIHMNEVSSTLEKFKSWSIKKIIIDLRGNPGGSIESYRNIAWLFVPHGTVINHFVTRQGTQSYTSNGDGRFAKTFSKIIILVDKHTASASEMLSLTLREYSGAIIVGEKTYGKWVAQQIIDLPDGATFKFTFAEWLSGKKSTSVNKIGIAPDVLVTVVSGEDAILKKALEQ